MQMSLENGHHRPAVEVQQRRAAAASAVDADGHAGPEQLRNVALESQAHAHPSHSMNPLNCHQDQEAVFAVPAASGPQASPAGTSRLRHRHVGVGSTRRRSLASNAPGGGFGDADDLPLQVFARRLYLLAACGNPHILHMVCRQLGGRLPLRLLGQRSPFLAMHIQAALATLHPVPPCEVALQLHTQLTFDGVHLTLVGFCAALLAIQGSQFKIMLPREDSCVMSRASGARTISGRRRPVESTAEGAGVPQPPPTPVSVFAGSEIGMPDDDAGSEVSASADEEFDNERSAAYSWFDPNDGVNRSTCQLSTLLMRWPQLLPLLKAASGSAVSAAEVYISHVAHVTPPCPHDDLLVLYHRFLCTLDVPCLLLGRPAATYSDGNGDCPASHCGVATFVGVNSSWMRVLGWRPCDVQRLEWVDGDLDQHNSLHWLWPDQLPTFLGKARLVAKQSRTRLHLAFELEAEFKRCVHSGAVAMAASSGAGGGSGQGEHACRGSTYFTRVRGVQSLHGERHASGSKVADVVYLSDFLHNRQPHHVEAPKSAMGEMQALLACVQAAAKEQSVPHTPDVSLRAVSRGASAVNEVAHDQDNPGDVDSDSVRSISSSTAHDSHSTCASIHHPTLTELGCVDMWTSVLLRRRLAMVLCALRDPLLHAKLRECLQSAAPHLVGTAQTHQVRGSSKRRRDPHLPAARGLQPSDARSSAHVLWQACVFPALSGLTTAEVHSCRQQCIAVLGVRGAVELACSAVPQMSDRDAALAQRLQHSAQGGHGGLGSAAQSARQLAGAAGDSDARPLRPQVGHRCVVFGGEPAWVQRSSPHSVAQCAAGARWSATLLALMSADAAITARAFRIGGESGGQVAAADTGRKRSKRDHIYEYDI